MSADLLTFPDPDAPVALGFEPEAEPELTLEPEPEAVELALEPEPERLPTAAEMLGILKGRPEPPDALLSTALVEILPADFPLPLLARFVPNMALRTAADEASAYALGVKVEGAEGLTRADLALTALRASLAAITGHFEEPTSIANQLHRRLTGIRAEWTAAGEQAVKTVGARVYTEQRRLQALADEERRKAQADADRLERERVRQEARAAEQAKAPAAIVEELKAQAETATAPPVSAPASAPPAMRGSTTVSTWKARLKGTSGDAEPNPAMADLTPAQRAQVFDLMRAVLDGKAALVTFDLNWGVLNGRAKAERSALSLPGVEAFEQGSTRAKGSRR